MRELKINQLGAKLAGFMIQRLLSVWIVQTTYSSTTAWTIWRALIKELKLLLQINALKLETPTRTMLSRVFVFVPGKIFAPFAKGVPSFEISPELLQLILFLDIFVFPEDRPSSVFWHSSRWNDQSKKCKNFTLKPSSLVVNVASFGHLAVFSIVPRHCRHFTRLEWMDYHHFGRPLPQWPSISFNRILTTIWLWVAWVWRMVSSTSGSFTSIHMRFALR